MSSFSNYKYVTCASCTECEAMMNIEVVTKATETTGYIKQHQIHFSDSKESK